MGRQPFQAIWDGLALAAWLVDAKSLQILQANEAASLLVGRRVADMEGMPILELAATPEDQIFWGQPTTDIAAGIHSHTWVRNMRSHANRTRTPEDRPNHPELEWAEPDTPEDLARVRRHFGG